MIKTITTTFILLAATAGAHAQSVCTRADLQTAVDSYISAQSSGDINHMSLTDEALFLENMIEVEPNEGLWNTPLPIALSRHVLDSSRCKTFSEVIITEGNHQYVVGTRLYVDAGKITRVDSLVTDEGDWLFNANAYLSYSSAEDWSEPSAAESTSATALINAANNYLDLFSDKIVQAPWGIPCARLEGGAYTNRDNQKKPSCKIGIPAGVLYIVNRDYIVDEKMGVINVFCRFGNSESGMPDSHTFRLVGGELRQVHTLSVNLNPDVPSPQATDNGEMIL